VNSPAVLCLGEALVDFVADTAVDDVTEAPAFTPSCGGSQANVAVGAARLGARAALAGSAGTDPWGRWLHARLEAERVDVSLFALRDDAVTTMAFVALSPEGEPDFSIYGGAGNADAGFLAPSAGALERIVAGAAPGVLAFGSDTLIAAPDRELLTRLKGAAAAAGWRVLYDPNLRERRWPGRGEMLAVAREGLRDVGVVKANAAEAAALTGVEDPARAAAALVEAGPPQAVVTVSADGAFLADAGAVVHVPARQVRVVDTIGAGDAVAAVLAAALVAGPRVTRADVERAMGVAAGVVAERGALTGLPAGA
jgi:sugar/nucleoside kinase (ribokinase family)